MPLSHDRQFPLLIDNLKLHLKAQGLRQRDIAELLEESCALDSVAKTEKVEAPAAI